MERGSVKKSDKEKLYQDLVESIRGCSTEDKDKILKAFRSIKTMTVEELYELSDVASAAGCSGCSRCCAEHEIGID